jgi:hypothetical protein
MNRKHLIWSLTTAALLSLASVGVVRSEGQHHDSHSAGALPEAARQATERFLDINAAIAAGYVQFQGCVSGPAEGAMGVHYVKRPLSSTESSKLKIPRQSFTNRGETDDSSSSRSST